MTAQVLFSIFFQNNITLMPLRMGHNEPQWTTTTYNEAEKATIKITEPIKDPMNHNKPQLAHWSTMIYNGLQWVTKNQNQPQGATVRYNQPKWGRMSNIELQGTTTSQNKQQRAPMTWKKFLWVTMSHNEV